MATKTDQELKALIGKTLTSELLTDIIDSKLSIIDASGLKSGANQGASGAVANEPWIDTNDNTIKVGV
jgi:hypothetical protein